MAELMKPQQAAATIESTLTSNLGRLKEVLQKSISVERFARVTLNVIRRNPKLLACRQESLFGAILTLARWGLEPGADSLAEAYLVPYKDECQPQASYRGLVKMVRRATGNIPIWAEVVKQGDHFKYQLGDDPRIEHRPSDDIDREDKPTTHAYAVAKLSENEKQSVVMTRVQLDKIKNMSQAVKFNKQDSPWFTNPDEMDKKTVTRRLTKGLPMKMEDTQPVEDDTEMEFGDGKKIIDVPAIAEKSRLSKLTEKVAAPKAPVEEPVEAGVVEAKVEPAPVVVAEVAKPAVAPVEVTHEVVILEVSKKAAETKGLWRWEIIVAINGGATKEEQCVVVTMSKDDAKLAGEAQDTGDHLIAVWTEDGTGKFMLKSLKRIEPN